MHPNTLIQGYSALGQ